jgi:hypothetical protein
VNGAPVYAITRRNDSLFALARGGRSIEDTATPGGVVHFLLWEVHKQAVASVKSLLALHAGAVSWRGSGVVLPGTTGSGKTTLVAGLVRAGFSYLSDDSALIELPGGRLHRFPKSLTLRPESIRLMPELATKLAPEFAWPTRLRYDLPIDAIRADALGDPCRVRYVISPTYARGSSTRLEPVSRAETLFNLSRNSLNLDEFGRDGLAVLADVVRGATCFRMQVGDLDSSVNAVRTLVEAGGG